MKLIIKFLSILLFISSCSQSNFDSESLKLNTNKINLDLKSDNSYSKLIKIEELSKKSNLLNFSFEAYPDESLTNYNYNDFLYCLNVMEFDSPITYHSNHSLLFEDDFNCNGLWTSYEEINRNLELFNDKDYIINIVLKFKDYKYLYNRLIVNNELEVLPNNLTCSELMEEIQDARKIVLSNNIDCSNETNIFNSSVSNLYFNGNGYNISNLIISTLNSIYTGFIGELKDNSYVSNLNFFNSKIEGTNAVSVLCGSAQDSSFENINVNASINSLEATGGVVGVLINGLLVNNIFNGGIHANQGYSAGITGVVFDSLIINNKTNIKLQSNDSSVGGLIGVSFNSQVYNSSSNVYIQGFNDVGGLIGLANNSQIQDSFSRGLVIGNHNQTGGLVGSLINSNVNKSFSLADVKSTSSSVGGLIAYATANSSITNSYATGNVEGDTRVGGLVGLVFNSDVKQSYSAIGEVIGANQVNGFIGAYVGTNNIQENYSFIDDTNSFGGITVLSREEFSMAESFIGFDFDNNWYMYKNEPAYTFIRPRLMFERKIKF